MKILQSATIFALSIATLGFASSSHGQTITIANKMNKPITLRFFSESEQAWIKPATQLDAGKTVDLEIKNSGDHNVKLILDGKDYLLGTYDLNTAIAKQKIDTIEVVNLAASRNAADKPAKGPAKEIDLKKHAAGEIIDTPQGRMRVVVRNQTVTEKRMRQETRTREVTVETKDGPRTVQETYTVMVPYEIQMVKPIKILVPAKEQENDEDEKGAQEESEVDLSKYKEGDTVKTKNGTMKVVLEKKLEMRTRVVTVPRTVTKTIETEDGPRTVVETVNTQVTQTYTVEVPVKKLMPVDSDQDSEKAGDRGKAGAKGKARDAKRKATRKPTGPPKPGLVFKSKGKVVVVKDSLTGK